MKKTKITFNSNTFYSQNMLHSDTIIVHEWINGQKEATTGCRQLRLDHLYEKFDVMADIQDRNPINYQTGDYDWEGYRLGDWSTLFEDFETKMLAYEKQLLDMEVYSKLKTIGLPSLYNVKYIKNEKVPTFIKKIINIKDHKFEWWDKYVYEIHKDILDSGIMKISKFGWDNEHLYQVEAIRIYFKDKEGLTYFINCHDFEEQFETKFSNIFNIFTRTIPYTYGFKPFQKPVLVVYFHQYEKEFMNETKINKASEVNYYLPFELKISRRVIIEKE